MTAEDEGGREPLTGKDYIWEEPPAWARGPLKDWAMDLTYDEVHAMELGLTGLVIGATWSVGFPKEAVVISFLLVGMAFGLRKMPEDKPVAARVVRREPWYFTTVYLLTILLSIGAIEVLL